MKTILARTLMVLGAIYTVALAAGVAKKIIEAESKAKFPKNRFQNIPNMKGVNPLMDELDALEPLHLEWNVGGYL
jgi:hypothetical protein